MKKHKTKLFIALALVASASVPGVAEITSPRLVSTDAVPHQIIVRIAPGTPSSQVRAIDGTSVLDRLPEIGAELWSVPGDARIVAQKARAIPGIVSAEPNLIGRVAAAPPPSRANDPFVAGQGPNWLDRQWYLQRINAPYAWAQWPRTYYTARSKPADPSVAVKIAVLDTWIDVEHPDWRNAGGRSPSAQAGGQIDLRDRASFINPDEVGGSNLWHGTFIAGLIGAAADNQLDVAGIAYASQIMPITVATGDGRTNAWNVAKGITWATNHGAKVINVSLAIGGAPNEVNALRNAVGRAVGKGSIVIAAAGNSNSDDAQYPAGFAAENAGVMAVGASDIFDQRHAQCSPKGRYLSIVAPDEMIWSLNPHDPASSNAHNTRRETCFTSFSTAMVSGVAGLLAGKFPGMQPSDMASRMESTADRIAGPDRSDEVGWGRVNAERALWSSGGPNATWKQIPDAGISDRVQVRAFATATDGVIDGEITVDGAQRGTRYDAHARPDRRYFRSQGGDLLATLNTSGLLEGPHEIAIRARDANGVWGPASTSVLIVDRSPPTVDAPTTQPKETPGVIDPNDKRAQINFTARSVWSRTLHVRLTIIDASLSKVVQFDYPSLPANLTYPLVWPKVEKAYGGPLLPGEYRVLVDAWNRGGLQADPYGDTAIVVLASNHLAQSPGAIPSAVGVGSVKTPTATPSPSIPSASIPTPSATPTL